MESREKRAEEIQEAIRQVLLVDWDPIGVSGLPEAQDEYDGYIGEVYRWLANGLDRRDIARCLLELETGQMGLSCGDFEKHNQVLLVVADKLKKLNISLKN